MRPDVLLLSGGGNDLVGDGGIRQIVSPGTLADLPARLAALLERRERAAPADLDLARYRNGLRFVSEAYLDFLNTYLLIYFHLVYALHHDDARHDDAHRELLIVTQGYDYVLPARRGGRGPGRWLLNLFLRDGQWLARPLAEAGIVDEGDQRDLLYAVIYEFNEMLLTLTRYGGFGRLRHLDVRGFAQSRDDWFDELHLVSRMNERLADNYQALITREVGRWAPGMEGKVWRVR